MLLSPPEYAYLASSLTLEPPLRPDLRPPTSFRSLTSETDLLPLCSGSARTVAPHGECIVGIKCEVIQFAENEEAKGDVEIGLTISGASGGSRKEDDESTLSGLERLILEGLKEDGIVELLKGGNNWAWKCYIDILLLHPYHSAAPISLLSLTTYLALRRTRLPKPISLADEIAHFNDDWDQSIPLYPKDRFPPLSIAVSVHGESTILVDPSIEECAVAESIMAVTVNGDKFVSVKAIESSGKAVGDKGEEWVGGRGGAHSSKWIAGVRLAVACGKEVRESLEGLLESET